ncbi:MAG: U32 family peptidase [Oscillospiraceae bacterium]|nr:U32 family peptidase [Oscillospiraceae bacterium]
MSELLSPAGSQEAVIAAVQSGADAVYLSTGRFNARRSAKNLTNEEFESALRYCRIRGCKVYVAVNMLISDKEFDQAVKLVCHADELGADAVIVRDPGFLRVVRQAAPGIAVHASSMMDIHNLAGVEAAAELGASRVILARELNIGQIKNIAQKAPVEVGVFVHGELCFCHSGQCCMSSLTGRSSANRGLCEQPCRLQYGMGRRADDYPLSLKDNCRVNHLPELEEAGVACFMIEGRMRRPEYTALATKIYSDALKDKKIPNPREIERLEKAFSGQGFTDGFITGETSAEMFGRRPEADREISKIYAEIRKEYTDVETRRVPVRFYAVAKNGRRFALKLDDNDGNSVALYGPLPDVADDRPITADTLESLLYKTGGTPYYCSGVACDIDPGLRLDAPVINEMRKKLLTDLSEKRKLPPVYRGRGAMPAHPSGKALAEPTQMIFQVRSLDQLTPELAEFAPGHLYVPIDILAERYERTAPFTDAGANVVAVMPRVILGNEMSEIAQMLSHIRNLGVAEVLIGNIGHIKAAALSGFAIRGDFGLNIFNSYSAEVFSIANFLSVTASFELKLNRIRELAKPINTEMIVYGRLPLMVSEHCIIKNSAGSCACDGTNRLTDRMGNEFPIVREFGCRNVILNSNKLFMSDKKDECEAAGLWGLRLMFTTESPRECAEVAKSFAGASDYRPNGLTRGLYYGGVE